MAKRLLTLVCLLSTIAFSTWAAKVNTEKTITVNGKTRKYILYVPNNVKDNAPLVISLHGASGHDTDRSPFRMDVADSKGCIVVYPQGELQNFGPFGTVPGWNATGEANEEIDFFKAIIDAVEASYSIDRKRIYCCGFSNGGMMTYAATSAASDIFAAFASISGFQLNEFHQRHLGERPIPFLHIHGKADDFVKFSCTPIIRDNMVARNGCNPVPKETNVSGKYTKYEYEAGEGGFPYIFYAIDGMGHNDWTGNTPEGNSALTMWNFMSQFTLDAPCDKTLKWRLNVDTEGFEPKLHSWTTNTTKTKYLYGVPKKANNEDNNVYPSLQFEAGNYVLQFESTGTEGNKIKVSISTLDGKSTLLSKEGKVGKKVVMPFTVSKYNEYKILITKDSGNDKFTKLEIHSCEEPATSENCVGDDDTPVIEEPKEEGTLIEIPQSQGFEYNDGFTRAALVKGDDYNTYTATNDLQIAIKTMNIDVEDCDYVIIKFAQPVAAGWKIAFWPNQDLVDIPAGATEYKFVFDEDPKGNAVTNNTLAQICLMTFFGGYVSPLEAKVSGIYKHNTEITTAVSAIKNNDAKAVAYYSLSGTKFNAPQHGINIVKMSDGSTKKIIR